MKLLNKAIALGTAVSLTLPFMAACKKPPVLTFVVYIGDANACLSDQSRLTLLLNQTIVVNKSITPEMRNELSGISREFKNGVDEALKKEVEGKTPQEASDTAHITNIAERIKQLGLEFRKKIDAKYGQGTVQFPDLEISTMDLKNGGCKAKPDPNALVL